MFLNFTGTTTRIVFCISATESVWCNSLSTSSLAALAGRLAQGPGLQESLPVIVEIAEMNFYLDGLDNNPQQSAFAKQSFQSDCICIGEASAFMHCASIPSRCCADRTKSSEWSMAIIFCGCCLVNIASLSAPVPHPTSIHFRPSGADSQ